MHILTGTSLSIMLIALLYLTLTKHSLLTGFTLNFNSPPVSLNDHNIPAWSFSSDSKLKGQCNTAAAVLLLSVMFPFLSICLNDYCFIYNMYKYIIILYIIMYKRLISRAIPSHTYMHNLY